MTMAVLLLELQNLSVFIDPPEIIKVYQEEHLNVKLYLQVLNTADSILLLRKILFYSCFM